MCDITPLPVSSRQATIELQTYCNVVVGREQTCTED